MNYKETHAEELFELLDSISGYFDRKIRMFALGGTALTILGIKVSTIDIDMNVEQNDYVYICKIFEQIGFKRGGYRWQTQEGLAFDLFQGNIVGTELLEDFDKKSKFIRKFGNIELFTLSPYDLIITKTTRGTERDFDDIKQLLEHEKIDLKILIRRYIETMKRSEVANQKQKLLDLVQFKFKEWNYRLDKKLMGDIEEWQP